MSEEAKWLQTAEQQHKEISDAECAFFAEEKRRAATIKNSVIAALVRQDGMTFGQILEELRKLRPTMSPGSLSPILSRMQDDGTIYKYLGLWQMSPLASRPNQSTKEPAR